MTQNRQNICPGETYPYGRREGRQDWTLGDPPWCREGMRWGVGEKGEYGRSRGDRSGVRSRFFWSHGSRRRNAESRKQETGGRRRLRSVRSPIILMRGLAVTRQKWWKYVRWK